MSQLKNELQTCLKMLKLGYVEYYNNWVQDTHNFTSDCAPEININFKGYELQRKRYKILKRILSNKRVTESDFLFLTLQPQIKKVFDSFNIANIQSFSVEQM
jgi:hypothetical protein